MTVANTKTIVEGAGQYKVTYERRSAVFGLIRWWEEVKAKKLSNEIHIFTDHPIDCIYFNGEKLLPNQ